MASSADLVAQVEKLLNEDESVLFTMKLSKNQATWTVAGRRGRLQSKPRIVAISGSFSNYFLLMVVALSGRDIFAGMGIRTSNVGKWPVSVFSAAETRVPAML